MLTNAFISKSCFSYQFYQSNYYYYYSLLPFFSVFKCLNDLDPVALSEEPNVSQFYRYFFVSDQKTKQNLQVLYFSAFLSTAIMHRNSMPVSVFPLAFDVTRKLNPTYPEVLATWTEPMKRNAFGGGRKKGTFPKQGLKPHLFISLVHSFVALPLVIRFLLFCFIFSCWYYFCWLLLYGGETIFCVAAA